MRMLSTAAVRGCTGLVGPQVKSHNAWALTGQYRGVGRGGADNESEEWYATT